jgi:hypothetical protein
LQVTAVLQQGGVLLGATTAKQDSSGSSDNISAVPTSQK